MSEKRYNPLDEQTVQDAQWLRDNYDYCFCVSSKKDSSEAVHVVAGNLSRRREMIDPRLDDMSTDDLKNTRDNYDVFVHITKKKGEQPAVIHFAGDAAHAFRCFGQILKSALQHAEDEGKSKKDAMDFLVGNLIESALFDEPSLCWDLSKIKPKNGGSSDE